VAAAGCQEDILQGLIHTGEESYENVVRKIYGRGHVWGKVVENLGRVTTLAAKEAEVARIRSFYELHGFVPPGNRRSFKP